MQTLEIRRDRWTVLALCSRRGDCPLLRFLAELEGDLERDGRRMLALLDRVSQHGPPRNVDVSHQVGDGIWEFIQGRLRVLWFYDSGRLVVCSHGFVKKSRKTPALELERARRCQQEYEQHRTRALFARRRAAK